jgi:hypothetical protein
LVLDARRRRRDATEAANSESALRRLRGTLRVLPLGC